MKGFAMDWSRDCELELEKIVDIFRSSIIKNVETFTKINGGDVVEIYGLDISLFKTVMTLNESYKVAIIQMYGPELGLELIRRFENNAINEVSFVIVEDLIKDYEHLPKEVQNLLDLFKQKMKPEKPEE